VVDLHNMRFSHYIDASALIANEPESRSKIESVGEVLNGIAHDGTHFILTGKNWKNFYVVDF